MDVEIMDEPKKFYCLSLSGGAIRGVSTVQFLRRIEQHFNFSIYKKFDVFVGTSVGALIAGALVANKSSAEQCAEQIFTLENMRKVMPPNILGLIRSLSFSSKYDGKGKREVIDSSISDIDFVSLEKPFYVITYNINTRQPIIHGGPNSTAMVRDVIDASSAAPILFPPVQVRYSQEECSDADDVWEIDGGVAANNPSSAAVIKATEFCSEANAKNLHILSVGTGYETKRIDGNSARFWGALRWVLFGYLLNIMFGAPNKFTVLENEMIFGKRYLHIDEKLNRVSDDLDNTSDSNYEELIKMGNTMFDSNVKKLTEFFH